MPARRYERHGKPGTAKKLARRDSFDPNGATDRRLNDLQLLQPSVLGHLPFSDKAATRRSSFGGCRFPFLAEGLFPFWYPNRRSPSSRYDLRDVFKGWQRSAISPPLSIRSTFESSPLTSPSASKPTTTTTTTMQFIRVLAALMAFGQ